MSKDLCDCGKVAIWSYGPGYSSGDNPNFCDDCVPRGCDCNYRYVDVNSYHPPLEHPDLPEGEEGKDWIDWYLYERDSNSADINQAMDKDNNPICYDDKSLWEEVEQCRLENKTEYELPKKMSDEERLEVLTMIRNGL